MRPWAAFALLISSTRLQRNIRYVQNTLVLKAPITFIVKHLLKPIPIRKRYPSTLSLSLRSVLTSLDQDPWHFRASFTPYPMRAPPLKIQRKKWERAINERCYRRCNTRSKHRHLPHPPPEPLPNLNLSAKVRRSIYSLDNERSLIRCKAAEFSLQSPKHTCARAHTHKDVHTHGWGRGKRGGACFLRCLTPLVLSQTHRASFDFQDI